MFGYLNRAVGFNHNIGMKTDNALLLLFLPLRCKKNEEPKK
jgi:hypothetical protein